MYICFLWDHMSSCELVQLLPLVWSSKYCNILQCAALLCPNFIVQNMHEFHPHVHDGASIQKVFSKSCLLTPPWPTASYMYCEIQHFHPAPQPSPSSHTSEISGLHCNIHISKYASVEQLQSESLLRFKLGSCWPCVDKCSTQKLRLACLHSCCLR